MCVSALSEPPIHKGLGPHMPVDLVIIRIQFLHSIWHPAKYTSVIYPYHGPYLLNSHSHLRRSRFATNPKADLRVPRSCVSGTAWCLVTTRTHLGACSIFWHLPKRILDTNLTKLRSSIASTSVVGLFWNFIQSMLVSLPWPANNVKKSRQQINKLWANVTSQHLSLRCVSAGADILYHNDPRANLSAFTSKICHFTELFNANFCPFSKHIRQPLHMYWHSCPIIGKGVWRP